MPQNLMMSTLTTLNLGILDNSLWKADYLGRMGQNRKDVVGEGTLKYGEYGESPNAKHLVHVTGRCWAWLMASGKTHSISVFCTNTLTREWLPSTMYGYKISQKKPRSICLKQLMIPCEGDWSCLRLKKELAKETRLLVVSTQQST